MDALLKAALDLGFVDVTLIPGVLVDVRYATTNNFLNENIYQGFDRALLHPEAFEQFRKANDELRRIRPGWQFLVFDALRPRRMQRRLFEKVKGTPEEIYVMDPDKGSVHNFGFAIDLSCVDESGREVDMGTDFDAFVKLAHPKLEEEFLASGELSRRQLDNRLVLRQSMAAGGYTGIGHEWWHFNARPTDDVRAKYPIFE
jgi:D-alanyl-D-alanine dipeptidase